MVCLAHRQVIYTSSVLNRFHRGKSPQVYKGPRSMHHHQCYPASLLDPQRHVSLGAFSGGIHRQIICLKIYCRGEQPVWNQSSSLSLLRRGGFAKRPITGWGGTEGPTDANSATACTTYVCVLAWRCLLWGLIHECHAQGSLTRFGNLLAEGVPELWTKRLFWHFYEVDSHACWHGGDTQEAATAQQNKRQSGLENVQTGDEMCSTEFRTVHLLFSLYPKCSILS